jgi:hypothetical protein
MSSSYLTAPKIIFPYTHIKTYLHNPQGSERKLYKMKIMFQYWKEITDSCFMYTDSLSILLKINNLVKYDDSNLDKDVWEMRGGVGSQNANFSWQQYKSFLWVLQFSNWNDSTNLFSVSVFSCITEVIYCWKRFLVFYSLYKKIITFLYFLRVLAAPANSITM